jgi:hypothetical protein
MKGFSKNSETKTSLIWLARLRMVIGLMFLSTWAINLFRGYYTPDGLVHFFNEFYPPSENPLAFYGAFVNNVILPARSVFAPFQLVAEGLMALGLLVGAFTPLFSLAGIFFLANTFLATLGHDWPWSYLVPMAVLTATFFSQAGRAQGVDAYLLHRFGERGRLLW